MTATSGESPARPKRIIGFARLKSYQMGDIVRIKKVVSHDLPVGIEPGAPVVIIAFGVGCRTVMDEHGAIHTVPMVVIDPGVEVCESGRWVDYDPTTHGHGTDFSFYSPDRR